MGDLERLRLLSFLPQVRIHNMHNCADSVLMKDGIRSIWMMCENTLNIYNSRKCTKNCAYYKLLYDDTSQIWSFSAIVSTH